MWQCVVGTHYLRAAADNELITTTVREKESFAGYAVGVLREKMERACAERMGGEG